MSPHIVEIGSFQGKSTGALGLGLLENPQGQKFTIHSVDPFDLGPGTGRSDNFEIFRANIVKHHVDRFVVPRKQVTEVPGMLAMHDCYFAGVHRVILEDLLNDPAYRDLALIRSITAARKHKGAAKPRDLARRRRFRLSFESRRAGLVKALRRTFAGWLREKLGWLRAYPPR